LEEQGRTLGQPVGDVLEEAVTSLSLRDVATFDVEKTDLCLPHVPSSDMVHRSVLDFTDDASRDSAPAACGAWAATAGARSRALAAALASMVANLTHGKEGSEDRDPELARIAEEAQRIKDRLVAAVDADSAAFQGYMDALRMPQNTPDERAARAHKMQEGLKA